MYAHIHTEHQFFRNPKLSRRQAFECGLLSRGISGGMSIHLIQACKECLYTLARKASLELRV